MSSREGGRVSTRDIQLVQNLIERCLQLYMNQKEVVATLLNQAKIEPGFTELVWQKLEEENQDFFKAYRLRLMVKHQINLFNKLLEKQAKMMSQMGPSSVTSLSFSNGSHIPPLHQSIGCYSSGNVGPALKLETVYPTVSCGVSRTFMNGESSQHTTVAMSAAQRMDTPSDLLSAHSSNVGMVQGINGAMIKTEVGYPTGSPFLFGSDGNVLETHQTIADGTVPSFSSIESNSQPLNEPLTDAADASSFGFLGQIPRNFSLSDLTADFSQSSDILEYPRSPFLDQGDDRRLDSISEGLSYEEFGND